MKWSELSRVIQENGELFGATGRHEKLIIFTEFTDTLNYLRERVTNLLGDPDAVVTRLSWENRCGTLRVVAFR